METIQIIRIIDVAFIGTYLIHLGLKGRINENDKYILYAIGAATIIFNGYHFIKNIP